MPDNIQDAQVLAIDTERAMSAPERISEVVTYVLEHFDQKTKRQSFYSHKGRRVAGFNSICAAPSIPVACQYYAEFKRQLAESGRKLHLATIYSFSVKEEEPDEEFDNDKLDKTSREFLESAISDYNAAFATNFDTSSDKFRNYYKDPVSYTHLDVYKRQ